MTSLYDDLPDTTVWAPSLPERVGTALGYSRCGCALPESCDRCDGTGEERWEELRARRDEIRRQWRAGQLTARDYYHQTAAVSSDGQPSRDAAAAVTRADRDATTRSAA